MPAERSPLKFDGQPALLTFLFGGVRDEMEEVAEISWEQFFALFDLMGLSLVHNGNNEYELLQIEEKSLYRFEGKPV